MTKRGAGKQGLGLADAATAAARGLIADNHDAKTDASLVDETIAAI